MSQRGLTLVELLVVLTILGVTAAVTTVSLGRFARPDAAEATEALRKARSRAIREGRPVRMWRQLADDSAATAVLFLPDGRALGDRVDPLLGVAVEP